MIEEFDWAREGARQLVTTRFFLAWSWYLMAREAESNAGYGSAASLDRLSKTMLRNAMDVLMAYRLQDQSVTQPENQK